jgi:3-deoxy-manno-octulosonate cytidylyltransferase (CMP-KDO synthetase)
MKMNKRVIGVIPSRMTSTRLPGKPLVKIAGKPMIQRVVERVAQATRLDAVLVAADDQRIIDAVDAAGVPGVRGVLTDPNHPSGTDRIAEAVAGEACDVVINIQGDEPLIDPALIDRLADVMIAGGWDMATAATPILNEEDLRDPGVVKAVFGRDGQALYFSRAAIPFVRDAGTDASNAHFRHIGIYAYTHEYLQKLVAEPPCRLENLEKLEQLRALHIGCRMNVLEVDDVGIGVDTPADVAKVEQILREQGENSRAAGHKK